VTQWAELIVNSLRWKHVFKIYKWKGRTKKANKKGGGGSTKNKSWRNKLYRFNKWLNIRWSLLCRRIPKLFSLISAWCLKWKAKLFLPPTFVGKQKRNSCNLNTFNHLLNLYNLFRQDLFFVDTPPPYCLPFSSYPSTCIF
jgi:hypothetical protein